MSNERADENDAGGALRGMLDAGIAALQRRMDELTTGKLDPKRTTQVISLMKEISTMLGHVRRYDAAVREETGRLSPSVVIAYLRGVSPGVRSSILATVDEREADEQDGRSVLS